MKKILLIITLVLSISLVNAQFSIGVTSGVGHSWLHHDEYPDTENQFHLTYNAGVSFLYAFNSPFAIGADIKFSAEGAKYKYPSSGNIIEPKYRTHYIRIPLHLVYFFGESNSNVRPKISAGPSVAFLVGGMHELEVNGAPNYKTEAENIFESSDFGLNGAIGVAMKVGNRAWMNIDINYYNGITNIHKELEDLRNRSIGLNLGLLIPIGTKTITRSTTTQ